MKNEQEKSDPSIVAKRPANKPQNAEVDLWGSGAESAEPREGTKGNTGEQHTRRTPSRESVSQGLERVREAAKQRKKERFTALLHHVTIDLLKDAYSWLKREAAPGVDGRTWQSYRPKRVRAHIFVATLAFLLDRGLEKKLKAAGVPMSSAQALEALRTMHVVDIRVGSEIRRGVTAGNHQARQILAALGISNREPLQTHSNP